MEKMPQRGAKNRASSVAVFLKNVLLPVKCMSKEPPREMNRPAKLRAIYKELRNVLGAATPAIELLKLANAILQTYTDTDLETFEDRRGAGGVPIFARAVDHAMSDGGWQILDFEARGGGAFDDANAKDDLPLRFRRNVHPGAL